MNLPVLVLTLFILSSTSLEILLWLGGCRNERLLLEEHFSVACEDVSRFVRDAVAIRDTVILGLFRNYLKMNILEIKNLLQTKEPRLSIAQITWLLDNLTFYEGCLRELDALLAQIQSTVKR